MSHKTVVICEKPNVAQKVGNVLAKIAPEVYVVAARGHLIELSIKEKSKAWTYPLIRDIDDVSLEPISNASQVLGKVVEACKDADVLVSATDLDREGSSIFLEIYKYIKMNFPKFNPALKRMEVSSLTEKEIKEAWMNLKEYDWGRSYSGFTRNMQDMFWGINLTRGLTKAGGRNAGLKSGGRVQTPMLDMIVQRDLEIEKFVPKVYYSLTMAVHSPKGDFNMLYDGKLSTIEDVKNVTKIFKVGDDHIADVLEKVQKTPPPPPFNGTTLQIEGNRVLGFSAKEIADRSKGLAQALYTKALISYPGTDSEKYPADWKVKEWGDFKALMEGLISAKLPKSTAIGGNKEDPAHPCLRPVGVPDADLPPKELKLFDLITRRCAAGMCNPSEDAVKDVKVVSGKHKFKAVGKTNTVKGWREVYPFAATADKELPDVKKGDKVTVKSLKAEKKETKPPSQYNIISLIAQCEKLGLGTKNTRPGIIEKLSDRGYVTSTTGKRATLTATDDGKKVAYVLGKNVPMSTSVELTQMFNEAMDSIEKNPDIFKDKNNALLKKLEEIMTDFKGKEREIGRELTGMDASITGTCPKCGKDMSARTSKDGKYRFFSCSGYPECKTSLFLNAGETPRTSKCQCGMPLMSGDVRDLKGGNAQTYLRCLADCEKTPIRCAECAKPLRIMKNKKSGGLFCVCCNKFNNFKLDMAKVKKCQTA